MAHCSLHLQYDPTCIQCQRKTRRAEDNVSDDFSTPSFGASSTPDYSPATGPTPSSDSSGDTFSGGGGESGGGGASGDF